MEDKGDAVLMWAKVSLAYWITSQVVIKEMCHNSDQQEIFSWIKPPIGVLKCNIDASFFLRIVSVLLGTLNVVIQTLLGFA